MGRVGKVWRVKNKIFLNLDDKFDIREIRKLTKYFTLTENQF